MIILMCFYDSGTIVVYTLYWPEMKKVYDRVYPYTVWEEE